MEFNEKSRMVISVIMLIMAGTITEEEVPDLANLREVVATVLTK